MEYGKIANRLRYQNEITIDDNPAMQFASLMQIALFFSHFGRILPYPQIGICPDGTLQIEWNSPPACALVNFMPDGSVEFPGTLENREPPLRLQGSANKETAMQMIKPIIRAIP